MLNLEHLSPLVLEWLLPYLSFVSTVLHTAFFVFLVVLTDFPIGLYVFLVGGFSFFERESKVL